jgi:hypothetical protein
MLLHVMNGSASQLEPGDPRTSRFELLTKRFQSPAFANEDSELVHNPVCSRPAILLTEGIARRQMSLGCSWPTGTSARKFNSIPVAEAPVLVILVAAIV